MTEHRRPSALMIAILGMASASERGVRMRDLVKACGHARPSLSRSLRRLERRGAVSLHRPPSPYRSRHFHADHVTVTPAGRELLAVNFLPARKLTDLST